VTQKGCWEQGVPTFPRGKKKRPESGRSCQRKSQGKKEREGILRIDKPRSRGATKRGDSSQSRVEKKKKTNLGKKRKSPKGANFQKGKGVPRAARHEDKGGG